MTVLHLGCGRRGRELPVPVPEADAKIITLDADYQLKPDLICKLGTDKIQLEDNTVDLAVAWHVLEHIGYQGETISWFAFWEDLYRVLKPGGRLLFESPLYSSVWCWADPSHTRAMSPFSFVFFDQNSYRTPGTSISPFRIACDFAAGDFEPVPDANPQVREQESASHFRGVLTARKPLRPWWND